MRRRDDDRTVVLVEVMALSRVSAARFRGLTRVVVSIEGDKVSLRRRTKKRQRRISACERVSETKVEVWCRIWDAVAEAEAEVVVILPPW